MSEKRIQFNTIIQSQLPSYVREDFPLVAEFLKQYYISQDFEGSSADIIQNIDKYLKLDNIKIKSKSTTLTEDIDFSTESIKVSSTLGFPDSYGLLQIDSEIITYTSKTENSFLGCVRGFSGVTSYTSENKPDQLVFKSSESNKHSSGASVINLSSLFLEEFFNKIKYQLSPGFENRDFYSTLDKYLFLKQSKDFYSTRGTDLSFEILFKALYGEEVKIVKPQDYLIKPSDSHFEITNDLVVESISGDPYELERSTLFQDLYGDISKGYAPITKVEKIYSKSNKTYYRLSFDAGYNRDINVDGSLYGNFSVHPKTKIIGDVAVGAETLDVDSTVGFPPKGELSVLYDDNTQGTITYTSKSLTQFLGCKDVKNPILDASDVWLDVYAYGVSNKNSDTVIKVRVTAVLKDINIKDDTYYYNKNDTAIIKTLGVTLDEGNVFNELIFNISPRVNVSTIELIDNINFIYRLGTKENHNLRVGDSVKLISSDGNTSFSSVSNVLSKNIIEIVGQGNLDTSKFYTLQRNLLKVKSERYSYLSNENANVQNVYVNGDKILVSSSSLPSYNNQQLEAFNRTIVFSGTFVGDTFTISPSRDHGFYTGDSVYYTSDQGSLFDNGIYFVRRVSSNSIKLSKSRSNLYNSIYVTINNPVAVVNSKIEDYDFYSKVLSSQKLLREIAPPVNDSKQYETSTGPVGILINGVEILNYKSKDKIYYGSIEEIDVLKSGSGYDIINPPTLVVTDSVGAGVTGYFSVKGSLQEIRIVDPGFDYLDIPKINIIGGNGNGARASASMKLIDHQVSFSSESKSDLVNLTNNTIGFSTYHKFRNFEKVLYKTNGQKAIGGISTNSAYYVSTQNQYTVKLHKTFDDALVGINTVPLTSFGIGNHTLASYNKKSVISSILIEDSGINYENKKRTTSSSGISTSLGQVLIRNHGFETGEIINYSTNGDVIGGLSNNTNYYLTKVDNDNFKLSLVGVGTDNKDFYFKTKQYLDITSSGSGIHSFNYPQISVEVVGTVGVSSSFKAIVQPIFRGEITSVHLQNSGVGYGSSEIINFNRKPNVTVNSGSEAKVTPIINNGKIVEILVTNPGKDYNSPPNLTILSNGSGVGAVLTPIVENGYIKEVKVIEGGAGYSQNNTFISISPAGSGSELNPKIQNWTINLFTKYFNNITNDDGFVFYNSNSKYGLQYTHLYAPRKLRENIYSKETSGKILYGKQDLVKSNNIEVDSTSHSPIIGWAYDGNPIYGPYGFSNKNGGSITRMKSGYTLNLKENRPSFSPGFFVEDYIYKNSNDDAVLDQNNGRFCITPDFPNGTYAYFATIDETSSSFFGGYRLPVFPYIVGNTFKSLPNDFNFKRSSNQEDYDLNNSSWSRNTTLYNLIKTNASYSYLNLPNDLNQTIDVKQTSSGFIESVGIITGGTDYKVNDKVLFDDTDTKGFGFTSKVSRVSGKSVNKISVATSTISGVEIYPFEGNSGTFIVESSSPHYFLNRDIVSISGLNTSSSLIEGLHVIGISTNTLSVSSPFGIENISSTGIVTYISVSGNLDYPNIKENDIFKIGNEKLKILNVDKSTSRVRVLRSIDGTVGTAHSYTDILYQIPRRFSIVEKKSTPYGYKVNKELYFNPKESLGIGAASGVGIGTTIYFSNPGAGVTQIFIPTKTIYIPNHNLNTGDILTYSTNSGSSILVSNTGIDPVSLGDQATVYVAKINDDLIGISTVKVGLGSTGTFVGIATTTASFSTLYLTGIGTGVYHSFKTNYSVLSGKISKNVVTVSTAQTHGLKNNDYIFVKVNPGITTSFTFKYNDFNRKVLVNPRSFSSGDVDINLNSISIPNHGFNNGQKVIYTAQSPSGGLVNNKIYYVIVFDRNTIKLSLSKYDAESLTPQVVNITSATSGTISPVNPPIKVYKDSTVTFDLSDSSLAYNNGDSAYSAFELNLYVDSDYKQPFDKSKFSKTFEVLKVGRVGIDTNASVSLTVNENIPQKLYYKLEPINIDTLPLVKGEVNIDSSVFSNNEIQVLFSEYNGKHRITSVSSTSFTYNIEKEPESSSYDSSSKITYETTSLDVQGSITRVDIVSRGQNYQYIPKFSSVVSTYGKGAILTSSSKNIGKVRKSIINDIGFDFPSDSTLRPYLSLPQILKIDPLNSLEYIGITSVGRGYTIPPNLVVLDGKTREVLSEIDIKYSIGDNYVTIFKNTYKLSDTDPIIIPTQNPNGVGISSISYNSTTKNVTVLLSPGFSTSTTFPFSVNDNVLIENVSVGINSTGKGFNSEDYNYQLFSIKQVNENIGIVTYNIGDYLSGDDFPGIYDSINSSGRIIPEKYFPQFKVSLKQNNFSKNEQLRYSGELSPIGLVEDWNVNTKYLKVSSRESLKEGIILEGLSSKTQGRISSSISSYGFINTGSYTKQGNTWINETGFLNNEIQRLQDNFYYQNFSYSLKSRVPYDTWENAVGSLNHTSGFKKFSDYQLESFSYSGISTDIVSSVDVTADIDGVVDLNCVYDFDLVKENALQIKNKVLSDEITFSSRILTDYYESVNNRVLSIDNISSQFNSNPRLERYSVVHRFNLSDARAQKYITYVKDKRYVNQRQMMLLTLLHDDSIGYLNQYGRVESVYDLGSFDFTISGREGLILFYPTKYKVNDYDISILSYNLKDSFTGIASTSIGGIVYLETKSTTVPSGGTSPIISFLSSKYTSSKILVEISGNSGQYEFDELNLVHDGTNVEIIDYGQLSNHSSDAYSYSGFGTYYAYISGAHLTVDFIANPGISASITTNQVALASTSVSGIGTVDIKYARISAKSTSIASSTSPVANVIAEYSDSYDGGYYIIQVSDITNSRYQMSEAIVVDYDNDVYLTEFGNVETNSGIGTLSVDKVSGITRLKFTPSPNIETQVQVYSNKLNIFDEINANTQYNDKTLTSGYGVYYGTQRDLKTSFELKHKGDDIFQRYFDASSPSIVSIASSTISITNHFFVTGEKVKYSSGIPTETSMPIGITSTDFGVGIGTTDKLPSSVYIIKIDNNTVKLAKSAEDALKSVPNALNLTSVGIGTSHSFISLKQNAKSLITIDNVIQSPVVSTSTTTYLSSDFLSVEDLLYVHSTLNMFAGDLIIIDSEIMKIESVGVGSTNSMRVARPWMGTKVETHSIGSSITKIAGNYTIIDNTINFAEAPYGNVPLGTSRNAPDERDWLGVSTSSYFHGRVFMRSGFTDTANEAYHTNYIFDDISPQFDGIQNDFSLKSQGSNIVDISDDNAIILINSVFQTPGNINSYTLSESSGITSISFVGTATSLSTDINTSNLPSIGVIVSVGSTEGFGYQPLVSAGGTAVVSSAGTISSISIGNSGSGYRSHIQTFNGDKEVPVRVGVATSSTGTPSIHFIGTATVNNGNIVSIAITNPGVGYTTSNPPYVIIDPPLSYSNIPLKYTSSSVGVGTRATVDIIVGQSSNVINFEIKNLGHGYSVGDILTIPVGGNVGIPTITGSSLKEFQISVESVDSDAFSGWSIGELIALDGIQNRFNGERVIFPLYYNGVIISINARKGSFINIKDNLLVFLNDILQVPDEGYIFNGGSRITFTEAPKPDDTCKIVFYKGSGDDIDVIFNDVSETVKTGDNLQLTYDSYAGQSLNLLEDQRKVTDVISIDVLETNPYFGPGNTTNTNLQRPVNWYRQTEDLLVNDIFVSKSRSFYEPLVYPNANIIQPVGVGSTVIYVENLRPFFNPYNENASLSLDFQNTVTLTSQDTLVSASATSIVSAAGTISQINIVDGGFGYTNPPQVIIQRPSGVAVTTYSVSSSISSGVVTSITISGVATGYSQNNPPSILIEPPTLKKETNKVISYSGDSGVIVGFGTTTLGSDIQVIFDLFIPTDSPIRLTSLVGTATTISSLSAGDFFVVYNSNIGIGTTGIVSLGRDNSIVGRSKKLLDTVYQVDRTEIITSNVVGVGTTFIRRVFSKITGIGTINFGSSFTTFDSTIHKFDEVTPIFSGITTSSNYFGNYSWGKIRLKSREKNIQYNYYGDNGTAGITSSAMVTRTSPLRYSNYAV